MARLANKQKERLNVEKEKRVAMNQTSFIVVDAINGFCKKGPMADIETMNTVPAIVDYLKQGVEKFQSIVLFQDKHEKDAIEFKSFPEHCLRDDAESEIVDEIYEIIKPHLGNFDLEIMCESKNSTNGLHSLIDSYSIKRLSQGIKDNKLDEYKQYAGFDSRIQNVVIVGFCTDICVMQFAVGLKTLFNEFNVDIDVVVPIDGVDTYHNEDIDHDVYESNFWALKFMKEAGISVVQTVVLED